VNREQEGTGWASGVRQVQPLDSDSRPWDLRTSMRRQQIPSPLFLKMLEDIRVAVDVGPWFNGAAEPTVFLHLVGTQPAALQLWPRAKTRAGGG
jgi:hypothetical protein